jgi:hypothetical protein
MQTPLNNGPKTADGKFVSGNKYGQGRPKGSRNRASLMAANMLDNEVEGLTRKLIELALKGDLTALRLCFERLLPPSKERCIVFDLPEINTVQDVARARASILSSLSTGEIVANEAQVLCTLIDQQYEIVMKKNREEAYRGFS